MKGISLSRSVDEVSESKTKLRVLINSNERNSEAATATKKGKKEGERNTSRKKTVETKKPFSINKENLPVNTQATHR